MTRNVKAMKKIIILILNNNFVLAQYLLTMFAVKPGFQT